jgi:hypothetical protein
MGCRHGSREGRRSAAEIAEKGNGRQMPYYK